MAKKTIFVIVGIFLLICLVWRVIAPFILSPKKVVIKIGYLPIVDHLILGVSQERDGAKFQNLSIYPLKYPNWDTMAEKLQSGGEIDGAFMLAPLAFKMKLEGASNW